MTLAWHCPSCGSASYAERAGCFNQWHQQCLVHLQQDPVGTDGSQCNAACGAHIEDPPSQLAIDEAFISCEACHREASAQRADGILPGLGNLVRSGKLDPSPPTRAKIDDADWGDEPAVILRPHRELSDEEIDVATPDELRAAYRALRNSRRWRIFGRVSR